MRGSRAVWLLVLCSLLVGCEGRARSRSRAAPATTGAALASATPAAKGQGTLAEIDLRDGAPESAATGGWFPLPANRTYVGLVRALSRVSTDADYRGVFVRLGMVRLAWAEVEELGSMLAELGKHKPVVCHAHGLTNATLWLTLRGCQSTWVSRAGDVEAIGIAAQMIYAKTLLQDLGVKADFLSVGKHKSAAEPLLRDGPSDEARAELLETLGGIRTAWRDDVALVEPSALPHLEQGPWSAREAKERELIDQVGDEEDAKREAQKLAKSSTSETVFGPSASAAATLKFAELLRTLTGVEADTASVPHVAVLPAVGGITMGSEGVFGSDGVAYESLAKTIDRLKDDASVRAVVLRIDSPGGSALASDLIWQRLRELGRRKPLIASVGSMAASGGYYLASAADEIWAAKTSIVGSIGVVGGKLVVGDTLSAHGVTTVTLSPGEEEHAAERAAYASALTPWDDATRARVLAQMTDIYELFLERVAEGRGVKVDDIRPHAEGRVFSGQQGHARKLVDTMGGLREALASAMDRAGLAPDSPITVEGPAEGIVEALGLDAEATAHDLTVAMERQQRRVWSPLAAAPQALVPIVVGLSPLLHHERVLAVMPYTLAWTGSL